MLLTPGPFLWSRDTNYYHHIYTGTRPGPENAVGTVSREGQTPPGPANSPSPPSCAGIWITFFYLFTTYTCQLEQLTKISCDLSGASDPFP